MWMKCQTSISSRITVISLGYSMVVFLRFQYCSVVYFSLLDRFPKEKHQHVNYKSDGLTSHVQPCSILLIIWCNKRKNALPPLWLIWYLLSCCGGRGNMFFSSPSCAGREPVGADQHRWHGTVTHWPTTAARKTRGFTDSKINKLINKNAIDLCKSCSLWSALVIMMVATGQGAL